MASKQPFPYKMHLFSSYFVFKKYLQGPIIKKKSDYKYITCLASIFDGLTDILLGNRSRTR